MTNSLYHRRTNCRLCGSQELTNILPLPPSPVGDHFVPSDILSQAQPEFPLDVYLCRSCGLAQLLDIVSPSFLYGEYLYRTSISLGLTEHFRRYANAVIDFLQPGKDALAVDIGSNDGTLLKFFRERGCKVLGVDPASKLADEATQAGIPTLVSFFGAETAQEIIATHGPAKIITANNVFANVDDIDTFIAGIDQLMAPDGAFVFETGYWPDLVRNRVVDNIHHEHLSYYSVAPLDAFFRRHGMLLVDIHHSNSKGGSIRGIVRRIGTGEAPNETVKAFLAAEEAFGLLKPTTYQFIPHLMEDIRQSFSSLSQECKTNGKTIAGYGAAVGVTTLMYVLGLGKDIQYLVDDNPIKHGLYSPGHHIPVLPSSVLYERKPDYVVLFPWRYANNIMDKHTAFTDQGGKFVLPLPAFDVR